MSRATTLGAKIRAPTSSTMWSWDAESECELPHRSGSRCGAGNRTGRGPPGDIVLLAARVMRTTRFCAIAHLNSTIAKRARFCAARVLEEAGRVVAGARESQIEHSRESALETEAKTIGDAMQWTVVQVAEALGVPPPAGLNPLARLAGVSIDSRTVGNGKPHRHTRFESRRTRFVGLFGSRRCGRGGFARTVCGIPGRNTRPVVCRRRHAGASQARVAPAPAKFGERRGRNASSPPWPVPSQDHHKRNSGGARGRAARVLKTKGNLNKYTDCSCCRSMTSMRRSSSTNRRIAVNWRDWRKLRGLM